MGDIPLQDAVLAELRILRKDKTAVTVDSLALAPTICRLLGSGDPAIAYTRLQHALLDATAGRTIKAAAASLGFASTGTTHLDRLVEGGADLELDQRQVRRLSDQGLVSLARLIASNWAVESVPELSCIVSSAKDSFELQLATIRPLVVEMSEPTIEVLTGKDRKLPDLDWARREQDEHEQSALRNPVMIERTSHETSVVIIWRGELWPKFATAWHGQHNDSISESLGNKLVVRLVQEPSVRGW
ncbi:MAG: hypothetical protein JWP19_2240 [Rhodoglobus sp.]|nr:hypothetical protein [Rhodoglobus sp.]